MLKMYVYNYVSTSYNYTYPDTSKVHINTKAIRLYAILLMQYIQI